MIAKQPLCSKIVQIVAGWVSSGVGSGYAVIAPGTWGSAAALLFWYLLCSFGWLHSIAAQLILISITVVVGTASVGLCVKVDSRDDSQRADPQWIVIDEWIGMFIALLGLGPSDLWWMGVAFVLFRVFDASKIGPVGWAERLPGPFGIVADDVVAGGMAAVTVGFCQWIFGS